MSNSPDFVLPENLQFTAKTIDEFVNGFSELYPRIAMQVNAKDFGYYSTNEQVNGQRWYDTPQSYKTVYRKRVDIGALPNNTTKNTAHGITLSATSEITRLYGVATDPSTTFIPLPYVDMSGSNHHIQLSMDGTNVILKSDYDYSGFTKSYVIIEFVQE